MSLLHAYQSNVTNRLYIQPNKEMHNIIYSTTGSEYQGAGISCYNTFLGWLLSFFNISSKMNFGNKSFYVNNVSFSKFIIRRLELSETGFGHNAARSLHNLYINHKETSSRTIYVNDKPLEYRKNAIDQLKTKLLELNKNGVDWASKGFEMIDDLEVLANDGSESLELTVQDPIT